MGEEKYSDRQKEDLYSALPAICYFMTLLKHNHPDTRIVFISNCDIKPQIIDGIKNAAKKQARNL